MLLAELPPVIIQIDMSSAIAAGGAIGGAIIGAAKVLIWYMRDRDVGRDKESAALTGRMEKLVVDQRDNEKSYREEAKQNSAANVAMTREMVTAMTEMKNAVVGLGISIATVEKKVDAIPCVGAHR